MSGNHGHADCYPVVYGREQERHEIPIHFFNRKEVRAAWEDVGNRWLFSVVGVIAVLTESKNPRNY